MGWRSVRRLISGYIATAMAGPRVVLDGTGDTSGRIEMYSADPLEELPAAVEIVPFLPALSYLVMTSPKFTGGKISRLELWTDGTAKLVAEDGMIIDYDLRVLFGNLLIESGSATVEGDIETLSGSVSIGANGTLNLGDRAGTAINAGGDIQVNAGGTVFVNGGSVVVDGGDVVVNDGAVNIPNGDLILDAGDIVMEQGRIKRGGAWALQFTPGGLKAGWSQFGGGYEPAAIIQHADYFAEYTGLIQAGTTAGGTTIHTLPAWLRPAGHHVFSQATAGGGQIQMVVRSDGDLRIQNGFTSGLWISLDGMRWPIAGFG